jgi:hypothetical protein
MKTRLVIMTSLFMLATACGTGIKVTVCLSLPSRGGFLCSDHEQKQFFLPYAESGNYIAMPSEDLETLMSYIKQKETGAKLSSPKDSR